MITGRRLTGYLKEKMIVKYEHFNMREHGFVGHLAEPDTGSDKAVIVIMGGEQSLIELVIYSLTIRKNNNYYKDGSRGFHLFCTIQGVLFHILQ